jgi:4-hydroxy-tetrahydrodipicolinate reductase
VIKVGVSGAGGKLAGPIIAGVNAADDMVLSGLFNPNRGGQEMTGVTIASDPSQMAADVIVETAHPDVVFDNLSVWKELRTPTVVGTSGFTVERLNQLRDLWGDGQPCLVVPNFSIGAVLMMRFAAEAAAHFEASEVVERHHSTKPDAPSGTALATAMGMAEAGGKSAEDSAELIPGARGGSVEGIRVHSLRLPGLISQQEVVLSNTGEVLSIEHLSTSYESFATGALMAIRRIGDLTPGVHLGLDAIF